MKKGKLLRCTSAKEAPLREQDFAGQLLWLQRSLQAAADEIWSIVACCKKNFNDRDNVVNKVLKYCLLALLFFFNLIFRGGP